MVDKTPEPDRRLFVGGMVAAGLLGTFDAAMAQNLTPAASTLTASARVPKFELLYECEVKIATALDFGMTSEGHRRIIPITGGEFHGPRLRGEVLNNGADWNLQRVDGTGSVEAAYYLKTDDGVLIRITNKGASRPVGAAQPKDSEQFLMFTSPTFEAPTGKYDWLNHAVCVGTLSLRSEVRSAVLIRVFEVV